MEVQFLFPFSKNLHLLIAPNNILISWLSNVVLWLWLSFLKIIVSKIVPCWKIAPVRCCYSIWVFLYFLSKLGWPMTAFTDSWLFYRITGSLTSDDMNDTPATKCWDTFTTYLKFTAAFFNSCMISMIQFLNRKSKDHRYVIHALEKEKKILKVRFLVLYFRYAFVNNFIRYTSCNKGAVFLTRVSYVFCFESSAVKFAHQRQLFGFDMTDWRYSTAW